MSTEQKTKETVCTSDDAIVVVTTKVEVNKDQCCGGGNQTGDFVTQEEFRKYQKFIRLHGGKGIYYNYQLSDGVTFKELGVIESIGSDPYGPDEEGLITITKRYIKVYEENSQEYKIYDFSVNNETERIPSIEDFIGKSIFVWEESYREKI
ncbi:hypothetical protein MODO_2138 [Myroides odoratimimus]|uniref:Uncharacterized protein n=2 Tax=Myroides odoratimimus TaxID=76832 RepID=A0A0S7EJN1_9FLAO|nr:MULTISPECIES: hypothetical protein [Myroides]AJA68200.1 hypothetical protein MYRA21_1025 [Myroides sp. A21]ALU28290.1 hypothetical protein AS202_04755 [Myroides odoratimimus]EHO06865.1 hypothetical protein HMPREF9712_03070 [Myroides odoratimimus CCUG 10230]EPH08477.1 hypothetical protein HMPREF9713_02932 [Myroides odoratimimus CCUG 12700]MDM1035459.1 hypothetical protein [Myroides odoratimimus]